MDAVTHLMLGAAVAQLPPANPPALSWPKRCCIGASAALWPDLDYLLFFWDPLQFLAYWHRAETHSLLLAPLWAFLLAKLWQWLLGWKRFNVGLYGICLLGLLSHVLLDSITVFGIQWFSPLSDRRFAWDLAFVVDGYLSLSVFLTLVLVIVWRHRPYRACLLLLPTGYLGLLLACKTLAYHQVQDVLKDAPQRPRQVELLPQPFSPLYWQIITRADANSDTLNMAYLRLGHDPVAVMAARLLGLTHQQGSYQPSERLSWQALPLFGTDTQTRSLAETVWHHPDFRAFRDFARFPMLHQIKQSTHFTCVWFTDARYLWPNILPSFRYGMCHAGDDDWQVYRIKYFSADEAVRLPSRRQ